MHPSLVRRLAVAYAIYFITFLFFISPSILRRHLAGPYAIPLADTIAWLTDTITQAMASMMLFLAVCTALSIGCDVWRWLAPTTSTDAITTPTELEQGTPPQLAASEPEIAGALPPAVNLRKMPPTLMSKLVRLIPTTGSFAFFFWSDNVVSLERPLLENLRETALYLLRGSVVAA
ncbi:hypothetical protein K438DRAFT_1836855, partial [Mycena galopus ATCC 62051]